MSMDFYASRMVPQSDNTTLVDLVGEWGPNLSSGNAKFILDELNLAMTDDWGVSYDIDFFINVAQGYLAINSANVPAIDSVVEADPGRATIIHCGLPANYVKTRVQQMLDCAIAGKALGATHFTGA